MRSTSSSVQFFANLSDFFFPTFVIIFSSFLHFLFIHFILNRFRPSKFSLSFRHLVKKPNLILCSKNVCFSNQVFFFSLRFFSVAKEKFHDEESWRKMDRYRYQFIQSSFFLPLSLIIPLYFTVAVWVLCSSSFSASFLCNIVFSFPFFPFSLLTSRHILFPSLSFPTFFFLVSSAILVSFSLWSSIVLCITPPWCHFQSSFNPCIKMYSMFVCFKWDKRWRHNSKTNKSIKILKKAPEGVRLGIYSCQILALGLK